MFDLLKNNYLDLKQDFLDQGILLSYLQPYNTEIASFVFIDKLKLVDYEDYLIDYKVDNEVDAEGLSLLLYGDKQYYWVILYVNRIDNPYLFNMPSNVANTVITYLKETYSNISTDNQFWHDLVYDYIVRKRQIKIIDPKFLQNYIALITAKNL